MVRETLALIADWFFYGPLCHLPLLQTLLGRQAVPEPATLPDHAAYLVDDGGFVEIRHEAGRATPGILVRGVDEDALARLERFGGCVASNARAVQITAADGSPATAMCFFPDAKRPKVFARPWDMDNWRTRHAAGFTATAGDLMALRGGAPPQAFAARFQQMLARGASRVRAGVSAPTELRRRAEAGDVRVADRREPYARFFAVEEYDLRFRRFSGAMSPKVTRATFIACDAVTVLPYDPVRDVVLVVDQFRAGPLARGDAQPWQIEAIAGRVDPGETPEEAARREAEEEAGLSLAALLPVAQYYPTPGCSAEYLYSFVAITDLPADAAGVFGVAGEAEDIRSHVIGFDRLMALIGTGEISNAPTILTAFWLAQHRLGLRGA